MQTYPQGGGQHEPHRRAAHGGADSAPPGTSRLRVRNRRSPVVVVHDHRQRQANPLMARRGQIGIAVNRIDRPHNEGEGGRWWQVATTVTGPANFPPRHPARGLASTGVSFSHPRHRGPGRETPGRTVREIFRHRHQRTHRQGQPQRGRQISDPVDLGIGARADGSCKLPPPSSARPATSRARRRPTGVVVVCCACSWSLPVPGA